MKIRCSVRRPLPVDSELLEPVEPVESAMLVEPVVPVELSGPVVGSVVGSVVAVSDVGVVVLSVVVVPVSGLQKVPASQTNPTLHVPLGRHAQEGKPGSQSPVPSDVVEVVAASVPPVPESAGSKHAVNARGTVRRAARAL
jgi:hypothetical protein